MIVIQFERDLLKTILAVFASTESMLAWYEGHVRAEASQGAGARGQNIGAMAHALILGGEVIKCRGEVYTYGTPEFEDMIRNAQAGSHVPLQD